MNRVKIFLNKLFAKLLCRIFGGDGLSERDKEMSEDLQKAREKEEREIKKAVVEVLLPSLPQDLRNLESFGPDVTPLNLFLALDALSMLIHRFHRHCGNPCDNSILFYSGAFLNNGKVLISSSTASSEMAHVSGISDTSALTLLIYWLPRVLSYQPRLMLGIEASEDCMSEGNFILLKLEVRNPEEDLAVRWSKNLS